MSRVKRIVLAALMVGLMAQGAGAAEDVSHASWFESVVQAIVSLFGESEADSILDPNEGNVSPSSGDSPEVGDIPVPWG